MVYLYCSGKLASHDLRNPALKLYNFAKPVNIENRISEENRAQVSLLQHYQQIIRIPYPQNLLDTFIIMAFTNSNAHFEDIRVKILNSTILRAR